jgi:glycosyltransferase involved in cell wall biosynthesis
MLFSVIVPVYNGQRFIGKAIECVLGQAYTNWELVIVNDGSTDATEEVISNYINKYPNAKIKLVNQVNKGLGAARNTAIRNSDGEYIALLDVDDIWYKDKLKRVYEALSCERNIDVVCHDEYWVKTSSGRKGRIYCGPAQVCTYTGLLFKGNKLASSAVTVRKDKLFEVGLFSERRDWHGVEDIDMWLKLAKAEAKFHFLNEVLGEYILHDMNMTSDIESFLGRAISINEYHFKQLSRRSRYYRYLFNRRKSELYREAAIQFLKLGEKKFACKKLMVSLKLNPFSFKSMILVIVALFNLHKFRRVED